MSHVLLISRSRKFESRLRSLVGPDLNSIMGASIARGTPSILARLGSGEAPDVALLGPALSYTQAYELSVGLSALYPRTRILLVREHSSWDTEKWMSKMKVHGLASPGLTDSALVQVVEGDVINVDVETSAADAVEADLLAPDRPAEDEVIFGDVTVNDVLLDVDAAGFTHGDHAVEGNSRGNDAPAVETTLPEEEWIAPDSALIGEESTLPVSMEPPAGPAPVYRGQVIAVVSPKGGMGKTTVATNLAVGLARIAPNSVVLVDADVQFGDVATALALDPVYSLPDAVSAIAASDTMILKTFLTPHPSGFFTICGAQSPIDGDRVSGEQLSHLITQLSQVFRYVVIDTAPGLGEHTLAAIERADDVVAICGMSVTSARGLRKHLEVLSTIGIMPRERHVVLNSTDRYSGLSVRDVEATTGVHMDVAIPRSKAVVLSSNRGIPVLQDKAKNPAWKAFSTLVRRFDPSVDRTHGRHARTVALK